MAESLMPRKIAPMLAKPGSMPANDSDYGFEMKWDGIRAILYIDHGRAYLSSRNLLDITRQYPEVLSLAEEPGSSQLILDGEIVALGEDGRPSFASLQSRMGVASDRAVRQLMATTPVTYIIFDLLYRNGISMISQPYTRRRDLLRDLGLAGRAWQTPGYTAGNGPAVQGISRRLGMEGVVAKLLDGPYQPGKRTGLWLKIKNQMRQELVVGGWLQGRGVRSGRIGALMVGYYDLASDQAAARGLEQQLIFAGKVGTGFSDLTLDRLEEALRPICRITSPFQQDPGARRSELVPHHACKQACGAAAPVTRAPGGPWAEAVFVEPLLVCEVEFTEWTPNNTLRHPSYKGLRSDKIPGRFSGRHRSERLNQHAKTYLERYHQPGSGKRSSKAVQLREG